MGVSRTYPWFSWIVRVHFSQVLEKGLKLGVVALSEDDLTWNKSYAINRTRVSCNVGTCFISHEVWIFLFL